ncbi:cell wall hydrolase [Sphingomonas sp. IC4-52]|uniref:cell wall hydrolase n=1 Tax=Sphingomonas sp. IC4-52 TaxID=2887202 RepID=UPI001D11A668|nr:cell wall hydrolase [Sphingomonas sp. IC4-52]MCC2981480.1 cell wall hydrolase [Sphingomonas sp. IC4-52]
MTIALHPSERAARRRLSGPARRRAWYQAARIAAPIVAVIAGVVFATLTLFDWPTAAASNRPFLSSETTLQPSSRDPEALASPGDGTTGTAPLPPLPAALRGLSDTLANGVVPARPFAMRGASAQDRSRALECLAAAIYYEAASEADDGQRAVAQVVLNRVRHPAFPATVCGVVYQGAERASGCQFSFACDGAMARVPARAAWARATRTAAAALAGYVFAPVGLATHYHTYAVTPTWNRSLVMTDAIGAHFFHRWKGVWGTSAAFHQAYAGHEPVPGPPSRTVDPVIALNRAVAVAPPLAAANEVQPHPAENSLPLPPPPSQDNLPESQILDRWKDSGKPLR